MKKMKYDKKYVTLDTETSVVDLNSFRISRWFL